MTSIMQMAAELDAVDIEFHRTARSCYGVELDREMLRGMYFGESLAVAVNELRELKADRSFRPGFGALWRYYFEMVAAQDNFARILDAGPNFRTLREKLEAQVAEHRAEGVYELACERYHARAAQSAPIKLPRKRRTFLVDGVRTKIAEALS